ERADRRAVLGPGDDQHTDRHRDSIVSLTVTRILRIQLFTHPRISYGERVKALWVLIDVAVATIPPVIAICDLIRVGGAVAIVLGIVMTLDGRADPREVGRNRGATPGTGPEGASPAE